MIGLAIVAAVLFVVGVTAFSTPVGTLDKFALAAAVGGVGVFIGAYWLGSTGLAEAVAIGALFALVLVAMPLGAAVRRFISTR